MKNCISHFFGNALRSQSGQTLPFVALAMTGLLGMGGLVIDVGHAYVVRGQLQNSANAAALAWSELAVVVARMKGGVSSRMGRTSDGIVTM